MNHTCKAITAVLCLFLLYSCGSEKQAQQQEQTKQPYLITASVRNCEGCKVQLRAQMHRDYEVIDSTLVRNGKFRLQGQVHESGFYNVDLRNPKQFISPDVYLPADSIHLTIDADSLLRTKFYKWAKIPSSLKHTLIASTSPFQAEIEKYFLLRDSLWNKYFDDKALLQAKFNQVMNSEDKQLVQQWADSVSNFNYRFINYMSYAADLFIQDGASPETALFAIMDNYNDRMATDRFRIYFTSLPVRVQHSPQGLFMDKFLKEREERNKNNQRFLGSRIRSLDLMGSTPEGSEVDESRIFQENKLTLVEFWASWCGSCRMELPRYYQLQEQFQKKGFGIIAVSLDNRREMWLKAIKKDGLKGHHVSELKGGRGDDMRRFEIKGIPANMLVDATGKIVAVDIKPLELRNMLQEHL